MSFESDMKLFLNPNDNGNMSIVWGDTYYRISLEKKYGKERVDEYLKKHPFIYDPDKSLW